MNIRTLMLCSLPVSAPLAYFAFSFWNEPADNSHEKFGIKSRDEIRQPVSTGVASLKVANRHNEYPDLAELSATQQFDYEKGYLPVKMSADGTGIPTLHPYRDYDDDTLLIMAKLNDPHAQQLLAQRLLYQGELAESLFWFRNASVLGFTSSLVWMGDLYLQHGGDLNVNKETGDRVENAILEALAWYKVAEMRGDFRGSNSISVLARKHEISGKLDRQASKMAKAMYSKLEEQRVLLGYPEFDNEVPPYAKLLVFPDN